MPKGNSGIGKSRSFSGTLFTETSRIQNRGFGEYTQTEIIETAEGRRMLNAVQNAAVGTEIVVEGEDLWGRKEDYVYRITGTTHNKRIEAVSENAHIDEHNLDLTELPLTDRTAIRELLTPYRATGNIRLIRAARSAEESRAQKAEDRWERQRRAAERRQYKINFD